MFANVPVYMTQPKASPPQASQAWRARHSVGQVLQNERECNVAGYSKKS